MANWKRHKFNTGAWGDVHQTSLDWESGYTYFAKPQDRAIHIYRAKPRTKGSARFAGEVKDSEVSGSYRYFTRKSESGKIMVARTKRKGSPMEKVPKPSKTKPTNTAKRTSSATTRARTSSAGMKPGRPRRRSPAKSTRQLSLLPLLNVGK